MTQISSTEVNPPKTPIASVIILHGLGASGDDFSPLVSQFNFNNVRFVLPNAPAQPVTINQGHQMPAWYDIFGLDEFSKQDKIGLEKSAKLVNQLIHAEHERGIPYEKIALGGFSQGGALSLFCGLRFPHRLGGVFALSCYLPVADSIPHEKHAANENTSIFMAHGLYDDVVSLRFAEMSCELLKIQGYAVQWHTYPMLHSVCFEEIRDMRQWLTLSLNL